MEILLKEYDFPHAKRTWCTSLRQPQMSLFPLKATVEVVLTVELPGHLPKPVRSKRKHVLLIFQRTAEQVDFASARCLQTGNTRPSAGCEAGC